MRRLARSALPLLVLLAGWIAPAPAGAQPGPAVPLGFAVTPYAAPGGAITSLAFGPDTRDLENTRLYVTVFTAGQVRAIDDAGGVGGPAAVFASGFRNPLGVVVADDGTVFVSDAEAARDGPFGRRSYGRVWRVRDTDADGIADVQEVVLKDLPNGRHNTNGMAFGPDGLLYVTNGNSTDDGVEGGESEVVPWSGSLVRVDPGAKNVSITDLPKKKTLVATGWRNVYDVAFSPVDPTRVAMATNGVDDAREGSSGGISDALEASDDLLHLADVDDVVVERDEDGTAVLRPFIEHFGFPSCLWNLRRRGNFQPYDSPNPKTIQAFGPCEPADIVPPLATFGLHVSADGLEYQRTDAWGADYRNDLFVAEFGNFSGDRVVGHKVVRVELDASGTAVTRQSEFLSGAVPLDVTFDRNGVMYVADFSGTIFRVDRVAEVPRVVEVTAAAFQFAPQALVIPEGTTVRWKNQDPLGLPHQVRGQAAVRSDGTQDEGSEIDSPDLPVGAAHEYRFDTPGTWAYTCRVNEIHEVTMHGSITVVPAGG